MEIQKIHNFQIPQIKKTGRHKSPVRLAVLEMISNGDEALRIDCADKYEAHTARNICYQMQGENLEIDVFKRQNTIFVVNRRKEITK